MTELTMKEKAETLKQDTLLRRTEGDLSLENTGRHAKPNTVIGVDALSYPRLPSGPWADPVQIPPEEPLGFSVEDHEPVGTIPEVQASIKELGDAGTEPEDVGQLCTQSVSSPLAGEKQHPPGSNDPSGTGDAEALKEATPLDRARILPSPWPTPLQSSQGAP